MKNQGHLYYYFFFIFFYFFFFLDETIYTPFNALLIFCKKILW